MTTRLITKVLTLYIYIYTICHLITNLCKSNIYFTRDLDSSIYLRLKCKIELIIVEDVA